MTRAIHRFCKRHLGPIVRSPLVTFLTGVGLFLSGLMDLLEQMVDGFEHFVGAHHGVMLLGIVGVLRGFSDGMEGFDWMSKDEEDEEERSGDDREEPSRARADSTAPLLD